MIVEARHRTAWPVIDLVDQAPPVRAPSWPSTEGMFSVPDPDRDHAVHGQRDDCSATYRRESLDLARGVRTEMVAPHVESWMEDLRCVAGGWIDRHDPCTFPQGTRDARERQVL